MCLSDYLIQLFSSFIASFCRLTLVAKARNGSSSNDGSSRKERPSRRTPSAKADQEANQEGIGFERTHIILSNIFSDYQTVTCKYRRKSSATELTPG